ncbi:MAG: carbohydrate ABC transporter permease [Bosea sp. (in: a-proteobacteria)]|uniref:carbohydrate ABC transporter permease n=1 Tax=Bosea sp. (in: a-proteobacteria) TaxID=1871050 RepID=UPI003F7C3B31
MRSSLNSYGYIAPAFALLGLVLFAPVFYGGWFSLQRIQYGAPTGFAGFDNYAKLFDDPELLATLGRTFVHTGASVIVTIGIALALSVWINRLAPRFAFVVQMIVIVPWIISTVVAALLFRWVFLNDIGLAAWALKAVGVTEFQPLTTSSGAMALLVAISVWKRIGYAVIILLAGLKGIPDDYTEAARIDGANGWQIFRRITLPLLKTPLLLVAIVLTLSNINTVETPLVTTGGGPGDATRVLAIEVYERAFVNFDLGGATALALLMFAGNIALVIAYVRFTKWKA